MGDETVYRGRFAVRIGYAGLGEELADLAAFQQEGLVDISGDWITITARGRLLVRAICMVFDRYLRENRQRANYSKVI